MLDKTKIDLNAPAFGQGAQTLADLTKDTSVEDTQEVKEDIKADVVEDEADTSDEENKVPYSRFKKFHDEARQAKAEAEEWRRKAEELESRRSARREVEENSGEMPSYWRELYGDSEASQKAWTIQQRREDEIVRQAYEAGQRGAQELEHIQRERVNSNVEVIDDNFEDLSAYVGRELTAKEQSSILDIVDEYTAKDDDGNYQGAILPFDKAWELYELKQSAQKAHTRKDRDSVAALTGASSDGDTSNSAEQNKDFNPLDWNAWKRRL